MLHPGFLIAGRYRVVQKLGEGAMGSVWLAKNEATDRDFAIKVLLPKAAAAPAALGRFLQEARICGSLRHPSILEIYDAGTSPEMDGAPYLVMERLDGAALDVVLRRGGALAPRLALDIVSQISRGLSLAHAKGVVHRDLKPANVFLHRPGSGALEAKVLDFGISKIVDVASPELRFTETSAVVGSPLYMSPEQLAGDKIDGRSDVHALGVLLWECLTGQTVFTSTSYNLLVVEILKGGRPKLRTVLPAASESLEAILERAFAVNPADRYPSAAALADALDGELESLGGGVLASRTSAVDVLEALAPGSLAPPSLGATLSLPAPVVTGARQPNTTNPVALAETSPLVETAVAVSSPIALSMARRKPCPSPKRTVRRGHLRRSPREIAASRGSPSPSSPSG